MTDKMTALYIKEITFCITALNAKSEFLTASLTALEAEVKRLSERRVCPNCHGVGGFGNPYTKLLCLVCNGTGYIESEE